MSISFFWLERGGRWGSSPSRWRRWRRDWTELSLGWNLLNVNLRNLNFSVTLIPTLPSGVEGHTEDSDWNNRRPRLKQQKTLTETTEDPNWNNMSFFHILINFHHMNHLADHQKLNIIYKNEYFIFWWLRGSFVTFWLTFIAWIAWLITRSWM